MKDASIKQLSPPHCTWPSLAISSSYTVTPIDWVSTFQASKPQHNTDCACIYILLLAAQQGTLLELLDAPQLMDTCVRNGIYDEALDLHAFIMRGSLLHPDLPVVKLLANQVS